ncbi:MAG: Asparagine synthetase (glutamine-hydrolyzing) 1 [Lentisphaerae bacterium ADurb.BinA184]|nr:MAG: Asparagine synthetase (glutamine-hydrolyzing) 1 [Lentisphaerae bacterium ADurb.BinA184]
MDTARGRDYDPRLAGMFDEPFPASAALSTAYVAALAAPHFKVMLSGEGGDELFGGYGWYRRWTQFYGADGRAPSAWRHPRNAVRGWLGRKHLPADPMRGYATLMAAFSPREMRRLVRRDLLDRFPLAADAAAYYHTLDRPELAGFDRLQWLDLHHFLPTVCLTKMDRTSMAVSLEVRVPFLDHTVADLVGRLPAALRNPQNELKGLLRRVARSRLPEKLLGKPKQGFSTPIRDWFPAAEMLAAMRRDREAGDGWRAVFAPRALEAAAAYDGRRLWRLWHTWRWVNAHPAR